MQGSQIIKFMVLENELYSAVEHRLKGPDWNRENGEGITAKAELRYDDRE